MPAASRPRTDRGTYQAIPGQREGDLVFETDNRSVIGTLVEPATRFVLLLHLPRGHDAGRVRDAMVSAIQTRPTRRDDRLSPRD